jgi:hypothetical protein
MARTHGRTPQGQRLRAASPHGDWKTTTFVAGLRNTGLIAPMMLDEPINGDLCQTYVDQVLVPELRSGDSIFMDNLGSHKAQVSGVRSKPRTRAYLSCRPTALTSTRSSAPLRS